jgi:phosphoesterase RecJ-like protein
VVLFTEKAVKSSFNFLEGTQRIVQSFDTGRKFDAAVVLDCAEIGRTGDFQYHFRRRHPLINIDHHETNDLFGDLNLVDPKGSSTGELVYNLIKTAGFPICNHVAEAIFAAIQTDTGSFRYQNTTQASFQIAAEMMNYHIEPWKISRTVMDQYSLSKLRLLQLALSTIELHQGGQIGVMTVSTEMLRHAKAQGEDCDRFVDYPRFVPGVELAVLIRQTGEWDYRFSLRSNGRLNVAQLASRFQGGGHAGAAGFQCQGNIEMLKKDFLKQAARLLNGH